MGMSTKPGEEMGKFSIIECGIVLTSDLSSGKIATLYW